MKKLYRGITAVLAAAMLFSLLVFAAACGKDDGADASAVNGTYYAYADGAYDGSDSFVLKNGAYIHGEDMGTYVTAKSGDTYKITFTNDSGSSSGTVENGVLKISTMFDTKEYRTREQNGSYKVTFDANGGKIGASATKESDVTGFYVAEPDAPARDGFVFTGWTKTRGGSDSWTFATDKVTGNITLYAAWRAATADELLADYEYKKLANGTYQVLSPKDRNIETAVFPSIVSSIAKDAFKGCEALTSVEFSSSLKEIGGHAFDGCKTLDNVTIPESITTFGADIFVYCSALEHVTVQPGVTQIGSGMFASCGKLKTLELPSSVTEIVGAAFSGCGALETINLENIVTLGNYVFSGCRSLNNVSLDSCTSLGSAFDMCTSLTKITLNDNIEVIKNRTFYGCTSLVTFKAPRKLKTIESYSAFENCTSLKTVYLPKTLTAIGGAAFDGCTSLTTIYYEGSSSDWSAVDRSSYDNAPLFSANVTYNKKY